ncbi:hypothetical protein G3545_14245 [Starkeya sp. ORNL1]|uniref:helix-turn-helix transcriptional regulator n=1 Tax=Starkeya sp. ORNL1 TaxID=2709380 RepID=UPI001463B9DD|nr:hypothetical protein [Starkeya sp. ORNL1]QJP14702.1 hypothetical protein G3545_14245 [Starkeya sp. ORNL1]
MSVEHRHQVLPMSLPPRGLSRIEAAAYVGVSPSMFDIMVVDGRMPPPKSINARTVWDRHRLDECFSALPDKGDAARSAAAQGAGGYDPWANCRA